MHCIHIERPFKHAQLTTFSRTLQKTRNKSPNYKVSDLSMETVTRGPWWLEVILGYDKTGSETYYAAVGPMRYFVIDPLHHLS